MPHEVGEVALGLGTSLFFNAISSNDLLKLVEMKEFTRYNYLHR